MWINYNYDVVSTLTNNEVTPYTQLLRYMHFLPPSNYHVEFGKSYFHLGDVISAWRPGSIQIWSSIVSDESIVKILLVTSSGGMDLYDDPRINWPTYWYVDVNVLFLYSLFRFLWCTGTYRSINRRRPWVRTYYIFIYHFLYIISVRTWKDRKLIKRNLPILWLELTIFSEDIKKFPANFTTKTETCIDSVCKYANWVFV